MAITLRFNVKQGDTFHYRSTFTSRHGGKPSTNTTATSERVVAVNGDEVHIRVVHVVYRLVGRAR